MNNVNRFKNSDNMYIPIIDINENNGRFYNEDYAYTIRSFLSPDKYQNVPKDSLFFKKEILHHKYSVDKGIPELIDFNIQNTANNKIEEKDYNKTQKDDNDNLNEREKVLIEKHKYLSPNFFNNENNRNDLRLKTITRSLPYGYRTSTGPHEKVNITIDEDTNKGYIEMTNGSYSECKNDQVFIRYFYTKETARQLYEAHKIPEGVYRHLPQNVSLYEADRINKGILQEFLKEDTDYFSVERGEFNKEGLILYPKFSDGGEKLKTYVNKTIEEYSSKKEEINKAGMAVFAGTTPESVIEYSDKVYTYIQNNSDFKSNIFNRGIDLKLDMYGHMKDEINGKIKNLSGIENDSVKYDLNQRLEMINHSINYYDTVKKWNQEIIPRLENTTLLENGKDKKLLDEKDISKLRDLPIKDVNTLTANLDRYYYLLSEEMRQTTRLADGNRQKSIYAYSDIINGISELIRENPSSIGQIYNQKVYAEQEEHVIFTDLAKQRIGSLIRTGDPININDIHTTEDIDRTIKNLQYARDTKTYQIVGNNLSSMAEISTILNDLAKNDPELHLRQEMYKVQKSNQFNGEIKQIYINMRNSNMNTGYIDDVIKKNSSIMNEEQKKLLTNIKNDISQNSRMTSESIKKVDEFLNTHKDDKIENINRTIKTINDDLKNGRIEKETTEKVKNLPELSSVMEKIKDYNNEIESGHIEQRNIDKIHNIGTKTTLNGFIQNMDRNDIPVSDSLKYKINDGIKNGDFGKDLTRKEAEEFLTSLRKVKFNSYNFGQIMDYIKTDTAYQVGRNQPFAEIRREAESNNILNRNFLSSNFSPIDKNVVKEAVNYNTRINTIIDGLNLVKKNNSYRISYETNRIFSKNDNKNKVLFYVMNNSDILGKIYNNKALNADQKVDKISSYLAGELNLTNNETAAVRPFFYSDQFERVMKIGKDYGKFLTSDKVFNDALSDPVKAKKMYLDLKQLREESDKISTVKKEGFKQKQAEDQISTKLGMWEAQLKKHIEENKIKIASEQVKAFEYFTKSEREAKTITDHTENLKETLRKYGNLDDKTISVINNYGNIKQYEIMASKASDISSVIRENSAYMAKHYKEMYNEKFQNANVEQFSKKEMNEQIKAFEQIAKERDRYKIAEMLQCKKIESTEEKGLFATLKDKVTRQPELYQDSVQMLYKQMEPDVKKLSEEYQQNKKLVLDKEEMNTPAFINSARGNYGKENSAQIGTYIKEINNTVEEMNKLDINVMSDNRIYGSNKLTKKDISEIVVNPSYRDQLKFDLYKTVDNNRYGTNKMEYHDYKSQLTEWTKRLTADTSEMDNKMNEAVSRKSFENLKYNSRYDHETKEDIEAKYSQLIERDKLQISRINEKINSFENANSDIARTKEQNIENLKSEISEFFRDNDLTVKEIENGPVTQNVIRIAGVDVSDKEQAIAHYQKFANNGTSYFPVSLKDTNDMLEVMRTVQRNSENGRVAMKNIRMTNSLTGAAENLREYYVLQSTEKIIYNMQQIDSISDKRDISVFEKASAVNQSIGICPSEKMTFSSDIQRSIDGIEQKKEVIACEKSYADLQDKAKLISQLEASNASSEELSSQYKELYSAINTHNSNVFEYEKNDDFVKNTDILAANNINVISSALSKASYADYMGQLIGDGEETKISSLPEINSEYITKPEYLKAAEISPSLMDKLETYDTVERSKAENYQSQEFIPNLDVAEDKGRTYSEKDINQAMIDAFRQKVDAEKLENVSNPEKEEEAEEDDDENKNKDKKDSKENGKEAANVFDDDELTM